MSQAGTSTLKAAGSRLTRWMGPVAGLAMFVGAMIVIGHELHDVSWTEVSRAIAVLPAGSLIAACLALGLSLAAASSFDWLGLRAMEKTGSWRATAMTSAIAFAFANAGPPGIALASGVRFRRYQSLGLTGTDVVVLSGLVALTGLGGGLVLISLAAAGTLQDVVADAHLPRWVGLVVAFAGLKALIAIVALPRIGWLAKILPSRSSRVAMIAASAVEWIAAAALFYVLLPDPSWPGLFHYLPVFGLAGLLGAVSGLPGGLGAFDAIMIAILGPRLGAADVAGALLIYRGLYIFLPLVLAAGATFGLSARETVSKGPSSRAMLVGRDVWRGLAPNLFALLTFSAGSVTLLSAATPESLARLRWLAGIAPPGLIDLSHFVSSLAGVGLLFLAFGLRDRLRRAWAATLLVLGLSAVACLLKGVGYPEAVFLGLVAILLAISRPAFDRTADGRSAISPLGIAAIIGVLVASAGLGLFAYKDVAYRHDLWWTFLLESDAPRFLRASVGAGLLTFLLLGWRLLRLTPGKIAAPTSAELDRAMAILSGAEDASPDANLVLLGDKALVFSPGGTSFVQYAVRGRSGVAMGEPVGPYADRSAAIWAFREFCDRAGLAPVFYSVRREGIADMIDCGLTATKIGESAVVDLPGFTLDGKQAAPLRHAVNRGRRDGATFSVVGPEGFDSIADALKRVSNHWLGLHHGVEKGFSLGRFDPAYLRHFPTAVLKVEGRIVAFANLWRTPDGKTLSIDLMRYGEDAPRNSMDILFVELIEWGRAQGYVAFDLGMAPLSGLEAHRLAPFITKIGGVLYAEGNGLYGFEGLRAFKQKYSPRWEAVYIAAPAGWMLGPALAEAALLSSGGLMGVFR